MPADQLVEPWCETLVFDREYGPKIRIERDPDSDSWIFAIGTWFHDTGHANGDEKALLDLIQANGIDRVTQGLEGFFNLVIGNGRKRQISIITDLSGGCHCYHRHLPGGIAFATSPTVLAALDTAELDPVGAQEFITTGVIYEDRSLWKDVCKLGPAEIAVCTPVRELTKHKYWRFSSLQPERYDAASGAEVVMAALKSATRRINVRFAQPLCDLTGGYDSRATIAGFLAAGIPVSTTVSGKSTSADVKISRRIAAEFNLPHKHVMSDWQPTFAGLEAAFSFTDGEYDLVEYSRVATIHRNHASHFDISVNGSFGELARGYWWELLLPNIGAATPIDARALAAKRFAAVPYDPSPLRTDSRINLVSHLTDVIRRTNSDLVGFPNTVQMDHAYYTLRMQCWQGRIGTSTNQIWPCISPFALRSVLIPVLESRWTARIRSLMVRTMLARYTPRLANIPLEHGYPAVPATVSNAYRFWPIPLHYANRAWSKVSRLAGIAKIDKNNANSFSTLVRDETIQELTQFRHLTNVRFIEPEALASFSKQAQQSDFGWQAQWSRFLTLEYTLLRIEAALRELNHLA